MKRLLKNFGFQNREQYFDMIHDCKLNGNLSQTIELIKMLPKAEKKMLIKYTIFNDSHFSKDAQNWMYQQVLELI